jgi:hypothetical protein
LSPLRGPAAMWSTADLGAADHTPGRVRAGFTGSCRVRTVSLTARQEETMDQTFRPEHRTIRTTATLLIASAALFTAGVLAQPTALVELYELDGMAQKYAVIADHDAAYRWGNLAAGLAAVIALVALRRLRRGAGARGGVERIALLGAAAATAGWCAEVVLRMTLVVDQAGDVAAGRSGNPSALSDQALSGTGVFLAVSLIYCASVVALALLWARGRRLGRPSAGILAFSGVASAGLVRSDPIAIVFLPPFTFWLGLPAVGIALLWGAARRRTGEGPGAARGSSSEGDVLEHLGDQRGDR